jgi:hypothetical protein
LTFGSCPTKSLGKISGVDLSTLRIASGKGLPGVSLRAGIEKASFDIRILFSMRMKRWAAGVGMPLGLKRTRPAKSARSMRVDPQGGKDQGVIRFPNLS